MNKIVEEISSKEFKDFVKKTKKVVNLMQGKQSSQYFGLMNETYMEQKQHAAKTGQIGIILIGVICLLVILFAFKILRAINSSEKSHLSWI